MYSHILIAIDGSKASRYALNHGLSLAKAIDARVTLVTATEIWSAVDMTAKARLRVRSPVAEFEEAQAARAQKILAAGAATAAKAKVKCAMVHERDISPAAGIVKAAERARCDLIVMGSHGRGAINRFLLGSQVAKVLSLTDKPVLVHR